jgi:hypothetical protein
MPSDAAPEHESPDRPAALAGIAAGVAAELSVPVALLGGYLETLAIVTRTGRLLTERELEACRRHGQEAAGLGLPLPRVVDAYLTATWQVWDELPSARAAENVTVLRSVTRSVLRAADDAAAALAEGYDQARLATIRREEALRREFIDDLLDGRGDLELLVERGERFGLGLGGSHLVAVAGDDDGGALDDATGLTGRAEADVAGRFGGRGTLVATRAGRLVAVVPSEPNAGTELAGLLRRTGAARVGVGRPHPGPTGVARSYAEAVEALDLARRLGLDDPVVETARLLAFRVLLRDRTATAELVDGVLSPLISARGGAGPLLATLAAYFATGGVAAETARRLHLGVRTVTYRLERVRALTGYSATDPAARFTLEAAVLGARLIDWPATPLPALD